MTRRFESSGAASSAFKLPTWLRELLVDRSRRGWVIFLAGLPLAYLFARQGAPWGEWDILKVQAGNVAWATGSVVTGFLGGFLPVAFLALIIRLRDVALAVLGLVAAYVVLNPMAAYSVMALSFMGLAGFFAALVGFSIALLWLFPVSFTRDTTLGSARWASLDDLWRAKLLETTADTSGFRLGRFLVAGRRAKDPESAYRVRYAKDRHLLTVAPTRAGKGVSSIIPNLLTHPGSIVVIDPKGENAMTTAKQRTAMGQKVHVIDPWGIAYGTLGVAPARFNPMDWLTAGGEDITENAMMLADALVVSTTGDDRFWDEEAKALLTGLLIHVATAPEEKGHRHLPRVRDLLGFGREAMDGLLETMTQSPHPVVRATGHRTLSKDDRTRANVMASAQSHTHFLDAPALRANLEASDVDFGTLKRKPQSVFLVLPADRLHTFSRWLRLVIQQAITVNARNVAEKPQHPILFMLDEMAALGRLTMVEQAYGLMAGFGMQLWGIVQDLSQLEKLYEKGWQTFVANSGVLQYFGSRDLKTAEYFSRLCGITTVKTFSSQIGQSVSDTVSWTAREFGGGSHTSGTSSSGTIGQSARALVTPDELMTMPPDSQLLIVERLPPIYATRINWRTDPVLKTLGVDIVAEAARQVAPAAPLQGRRAAAPFLTFPKSG